jgi:acyl-CoA reductase-like NAD-dependent aldehyde dehydrogenase
MFYRDQLFIDGQWSAPDSGDAIDVISPHSQEVIGRAALATAADVDRAVRAARSAFDDGPWPRMQPADRIAAINRLAELYKERRGDMAALITAEIGAPISFAKRAQVGIPQMMFAAFAGLASGYDWQESRPGLYGNDIRINKQPVGVVAAVVPWNMPQFLTVCKIVPALLAGCCVVLKPAPESILDAQLLADIAAQADLPPGVFNVVPGERAVGESLVSHPGVDKVSFHRFDCCRPPGRGGLRPGSQAGQPRTGRKVCGHRSRRRRPGEGRGRHPVRKPGQQRPGVQCTEPHLGSR